MHLTYLSENESPSPDRPVLKIEITPEMIEAGVLVFLEYDERFSQPEEAVEEICKAMLEVSSLV